MNAYRLGVDIGGTFTDIVLLDESGTLYNKKILSTPDDYSRAIEEGVRELLKTTGVKASEIVEPALRSPPTPSSNVRVSPSRWSPRKAFATSWRSHGSAHLGSTM
jgi:predicted NBD/HSP70 family sugar kinase